MTSDDNMRMARYLLATATDATEMAFLAMAELHPTRYAHHMKIADAARAKADRLLGFRDVTP